MVTSRPAVLAADGGVREVKSPIRQQQVDAESELQRNPLYGVAMLKIAMELKKAPESTLDEIVRGVLAKMGLSEGELQSFLEQNSGLLEAIARRRRY